MVPTQRSYHPLFAMGHRRQRQQQQTVMSPTTPLEPSPDTCQQTKQLTPTFMSLSHDALGRRQTFIRVSPSHDVIGSLSRTYSRHSCRQRRDSTGRRTLKTLVFFLSLSLSLSHLPMFDQAPY